MSVVQCLGWRWWVNHRTLSVFCSLFSLCVVWVSLFAVFWWSWSCLSCRWWWWQWLRETRKERRNSRTGRREEEDKRYTFEWGNLRSLFPLSTNSFRFSFPSSVYPYYRGWTLGLIRGSQFVLFIIFSLSVVPHLSVPISWHRMMPHCMSRDHRRGRRSLFTLPSPSVYVALVWCSLSSPSFPLLLVFYPWVHSWSNLSLSLSFCCNIFTSNRYKRGMRFAMPCLWKGFRISPPILRMKRRRTTFREGKRTKGCSLSSGTEWRKVDIETFFA